MCWWALIMGDWGRSVRPQAFLFNWSRSIFWIFSSIVKRVSLNFSVWSSQKDLQFMLSVMFPTFKKLSPCEFALMGNVKQSWVGSKAQEKKQPWIFLKTKKQRSHIRLVLNWCMLHVTFSPFEHHLYIYRVYHQNRSWWIILFVLWCYITIPPGPK